MTKAKADGKKRSPMRQCADNIADKIIIALVELIDKGGHGLVLTLTMTVSVGSNTVGTNTGGLGGAPGGGPAGYLRCGQ